MNSIIVRKVVNQFWNSIILKSLIPSEKFLSVSALIWLKSVYALLGSGFRAWLNHFRVTTTV